MDDLKIFCCQNRECSDYGQRGLGNLRVCFVHVYRHGELRIARRGAWGDLGGQLLMDTDPIVALLGWPSGSVQR